MLNSDPHNISALNLMGLLAVTAKLYKPSIIFFKRALKLSPKSAEIQNNLANSLIFDNQIGASIVHLRKALKINPRLIEAHLNMGRAYRALGDAAASLRSYNSALDVDPACTPALIAIAEIMASFGELDEASNAFRKILEIDPQNCAAIAGLAASQQFKSGNIDIQKIENLIESKPKLNGEDMARLYHAASKIRDDMEDFDKAFEHLLNAKKCLGKPFNIFEYRKFVSNICNNINQFDFVGKIGSSSGQPVFIVGMPRSGTTLIEQILASHPDAVGAGELNIIDQLAKEVLQIKSGSPNSIDVIRNITSKQANELAKQYLNEIRKHSNSAKVIIDKTPHNYEYLGLISKMFPNSRVIHAVRNPIDTCLSCFSHFFSDFHAYNNDLEALGLYYREYTRLINHWKKILPIKIMDVRYEHLIYSQEKTSISLMKFIDLDWDEGCLEFYKTYRKVDTPSKWQVRQPIYSSSVGRWKRYENQLEPLILALGDLV